MSVADLQNASAGSLSAQPARRFILKSLGFLFAGALLAISATMNWHFGTTLGKGEVEQQLFGVASLAVDGLKAVLPLFVIFLWKASHRFMCAVALLLWTLCFSWSMSSAIGFSASSREMAQAEKSGAIERRQADTARETDIRAKLSALPPHRASNVVESELETTDISVAIMRRTNGCTELTREDSRLACEPAMKLRRELAVAQQAEKLEAELKTVEGALYTTAGSVPVADPQVYTLSKLTGFSVEQIKVGLSLLIAILVELASGFGFTLVALATSKDTLQRIELRSMIRADKERLRAQVSNARLEKLVDRIRVGKKRTKEASAVEDRSVPREPAQAIEAASVAQSIPPEPRILREHPRLNPANASVRSTPHQVEGIARQATNGFSPPTDLALPSSRW